MAQQLVKVVLSSGKTVFLRNMLISDSEKAAQKVAPQAAGDANVLQFLMQKAILQALIVKIAPNKDVAPANVTGEERQNMDGLFTVQEYSQLIRVIQKMTGGDEAVKDLPLEMVEG